MKISPVCVYLQIPQFDDDDIGPRRTSIGTLDPPLERAFQTKQPLKLPRPDEIMMRVHSRLR